MSDAEDTVKNIRQMRINNAMQCHTDELLAMIALCLCRIERKLRAIPDADQIEYGLPVFITGSHVKT